jgi:hypothetical protein
MHLFQRTVTLHFFAINRVDRPREIALGIALLRYPFSTINANNVEAALLRGSVVPSLATLV